MEGITNKSVNKEQQAQNFENLKYDSIENGNILFDNSSNPDLHFHNTNIQNLNTPYIFPEDLQKFLGDDKDENVSVLHLNIRSINKNFENFKMFLSNLNFSFSTICFSETWLNDSNVDNSNYELPNYVSVHQGERFQYIFIRIVNLKLEMILALTAKILTQTVSNFCMKKKEQFNLMLSIDYPRAK